MKLMNKEEDEENKKTKHLYADGIRCNETEQ